MLTENEKTRLMRRLPKFELSYDKILHRKVYANFYMIIPKGPKALMWITYIEGKNVCIIAQFGYRGNIKSFDTYNMCFDNELAMGYAGTLIYGTFLNINKNMFFTCENIHYFKGDYVEKKMLKEKLELFKIMFSTYIKQITFGKNFIIPSLPVCKTKYGYALDEIKTLPYSVYGIQHHTTHSKHGSLGISIIKEKFIPEAIFRVKATLEADIYNIYCFDPQKKDIPYEIAMVPNYKSSVMMNNLFRRIKENSNLDFLEESDDEEEFENVSDDKFVNLNKVVIMKCV